jgi:hypothetical protein
MPIRSCIFILHVMKGHLLSARSAIWRSNVQMKLEICWQNGLNSWSYTLANCLPPNPVRYRVSSLRSVYVFVLHVQGKCQEPELIMLAQMLCGEGKECDWSVLSTTPSQGHITQWKLTVTTQPISWALPSNGEFRTPTNDSMLPTRHLHLHDNSYSGNTAL